MRTSLGLGNTWISKGNICKDKENSNSSWKAANDHIISYFFSCYTILYHILTYHIITYYITSFYLSSFLSLSFLKRADSHWSLLGGNSIYHQWQLTFPLIASIIIQQNTLNFFFTSMDKFNPIFPISSTQHIFLMT